MSWSAKLRRAREKAGLTVELAAKAAGVSPRTWAHWEAGQRLPPVERDAITRERLIARLNEQAAPGNPKRLVRLFTLYKHGRRNGGLRTFWAEHRHIFSHEESQIPAAMRARWEITDCGERTRERWEMLYRSERRISAINRSDAPPQPSAYDRRVSMRLVQYA
jgi:transcriptional regulator with XRE-family HTH domain